MANKKIFLKACKTIEENKKSYAEKAQETRQHSARLAEMQKYVDMSEEKRALLMDLILNGKSSDSDETVLEKGALVYVKFLDVIAQLEQDFKDKGVEVFVIQGKTTETKRRETSKEFRGNPSSKVVLISAAASESLNLNATNEIFLYDIPDGPGKFNQTIGRIVRSFSRFEKEGRQFYIHYVLCEETLDMYKPILLSSKKQLEEDILHADTINLKQTGSFDAQVLKEIRKELLWKTKKRKTSRNL